MVNMNCQRFVARGSNGKYELNVQQIGELFADSAGLSDRIRGFRLDRLSRIATRDLPVDLEAGATVVLHLLPAESFSRLRSSVDVAPLFHRHFCAEPDDLAPLGSGVTDLRLNLDGLLSCYPPSGQANTYLQLFRNGVIETATTRWTRWTDDDKGIIQGQSIQDDLRNRIPELLKALDYLRFGPPVVVGLGLLGVKGYMMSASLNPELSWYTKVDRNEVVVPELVVKQRAIDDETMRRFLFDPVWQAAGWPGARPHVAG